MEKNFTDLFYRSTQDLARTLVLKSVEVADNINTVVKIKHGDAAVDIHDQTTWKYYMHICGEYHFTDTEMYVTSLDTLESILFSKENLRIHKATAKGYGFGTRYYESLVRQYPEQEALIRGILYPANMSTAIDAPDFTILAYPKALVEPQEITLMHDLQRYIYNFADRWFVQAFSTSHDLYVASFIGMLYMNIYAKLINLRLRRCKTHEAHTFHIREYLASHGRLDRFLPYMSQKQALYFYRNILYIDRNNGKVEMFRELVEHVLTERHISLSEYSVRQLSSFDEELKPILTVRKKPVNTQYNIPEKDYFTILDLYSKEKPLAMGNSLFYSEHEASVTAKFQNSPSSVVQTKDLESAMFDYNNAVPDPLVDVLRREWLSHAMNGRYNVIVQFKDPVTAEHRSLYAKDAYIYMMYIKLMSSGYDIKHVPTLINEKERRVPLPTVDELVSIVPDNRMMRTIANGLLENMPPLTSFLSRTSFYEYAYALYEANRLQWYLVSNTHNMYNRAYVANMVYKLYCDKAYEYPDPTKLIGEWLDEHDLPVYNFTVDQADKLVSDIFQSAVGLIIDDTKVLANVQKAMLALLLQLSSYSIQIIRDTHDGDIIPINTTGIRVGDVNVNIVNREPVETSIQVLDALTDIKHVVNAEVVPYKHSRLFTTGSKSSHFVPVNDVRFKCSPVKEKHVIDLCHMHVGFIDKNLPEGVVEQYPGEYLFNSLTPDQKRTFLERP